MPVHFGVHFFMACNQAQSPAQRYRETIEQADVRTLDYDRVDQSMGLVGSVEHSRSQLRDIALTLRPGRIIGWFDFGASCRTRTCWRACGCLAQRLCPNGCTLTFEHSAFAGSISTRRRVWPGLRHVACKYELRGHLEPRVQLIVARSQ